VRSSILYGSVIWSISKKLEKKTRTNKNKDGKMNGCSERLHDRVPSTELRDRLAVENISTVLQRNRLRWFGHVQRKPDSD